MSVSIRRFKSVPMPEAEAKELASVCRGTFSAEELANSEEWTYALLYRKTPDGPLGGFLLLDTPEGRSHATLRFLCAKERGTGIPQALVAVAEQIARERKRSVLDLELVELAPALIDVYRRMGFVEDPEQSGWMMKRLRKGGLRGLRVKKQTRRTKGKRRNTIREKL